MYLSKGNSNNYFRRFSIHWHRAEVTVPTLKYTDLKCIGYPVHSHKSVFDICLSRDPVGHRDSERGWPRGAEQVGRDSSSPSRDWVSSCLKQNQSNKHTLSCDSRAMLFPPEELRHFQNNQWNPDHSCDRTGTVNADQVARCTVFPPTHWCGCGKKQRDLVGLCFGGRMALDLRLSRARTGVVAMRQDSNY